MVVDSTGLSLFIEEEVAFILRIAVGLVVFLYTKYKYRPLFVIWKNVFILKKTKLVGRSVMRVQLYNNIALCFLFSTS